MLYLLKQVLHSPEASGTKSVSPPFLPSPETSVPLVSDVTRWADWTQREITKCPVFVTFQHVLTENKEGRDRWFPDTDIAHSCSSGLSFG